MKKATLRLPNECHELLPDDPGERPDDAVPLRPADYDDARMIREDALAVGPGAVARDVEHEVVAIRVPREVLLHVVDNVISAERADDVDVLRTADPCHLGAERLRDLDGERSDASGRAVDEHFLTNVEPALVP